MNESSGTTAIDSSGNGFHGTYSGGVTLGASGPFATETAADFDGTDDYMSVPNNAAFNTLNEYTLMAWLYIDTLTPDHNIFSKGTDVASNLDWDYRIINSSGGDTRFSRQNGPNSICDSGGTTPVDAGVWQHHVIRYRDTGPSDWEMTSFVDCTQTCLHTTTLGPPTNTSPLYFGRRIDGIWFMNGRMAEVALFDRALASDEITAQCEEPATVSDCTLSADDDILLIDASGASSSVLIPLPPAGLVRGHIYYIKKIDDSPNDIILDPDEGELIDHQGTATIYQPNDALAIVSDGTEWWIVADYNGLSQFGPYS